ncbi:MAG: response regulator, partial [Deltaproteobacteria bacterium]
MAEEAKRATTDGDDVGQQPPPVRVLLVEEDRVEGGMLAFHLRREGLVVMLAGSGDEAIDALSWAPPDAIMIEAHGRELDGFEVIRALGETPLRVFLLADGLLELEDDLEALRLGVTDVFTKPVDPALVARRVTERPAASARGSIPDLPDNGISGDLNVHSVAHLLTLCHRHRMNARLHVELDGDWGVLLIRHGDVIDAESPGATGREAAFAAIRRAEGTFVLFPLSLDADELTRDDVVRADVATLFTEALGRPATRQTPLVRPEEQQHVIEITLPARESPRGPLSRPAARRLVANSNDTLEYEATPSELIEMRNPGADTRARIRRQVGIPVDTPPAQPPETKTTPLMGAINIPELAAPEPAEPAAPRGQSRADNAPRRRVT